MKPVTIADHEAGLGPYFVIRNQVDWEAYCTGIVPVPGPPVDFRTSMVLAYSRLFSTTCIDLVDFRQACYFEDRVDVYYDYRDGNYDEACNPVMVCGLLLIPVYITVAAEVPQSSLPVSWVVNDLCPR